MKCYRIRPDYYDYWGEDADETTVLTSEEIENICRGWEVSVVDILHQLEVLPYEL